MARYHDDSDSTRLLSEVVSMQFNDKQLSRAEKTRTTNNEGGEAFDAATPELALTKVVINNLLEDTYYESAEEQFESVEEEFGKCADNNPEFVLKLAKYARQAENLRQIPQALLVLSVENETTRPFVEQYARGIMSRTDEPLEVLALWVSRNGKTIPGVLRRSIESAMHQWNEWQYAKWDRDSREWQYRDLLNLVHPKPRDEERDDIFEKIAHGELSEYDDVEPLRQEDTWESSLSNDSDDRSKKEKYEEQLAEGNMGLFPRIRQARDMLESGVSADDIYGDVTDEWVQNSNLFPFRFYQAYKAVKGSGISRNRGYTGVSTTSTDIPANEQKKALQYLETFMQASTENLPDILEDTFVAVDTSGSMNSSVSGDSDLQCVEIGALFGSLVYERGADLAAFATDIQEYHGDRMDSVVTNAESIAELNVGGGTSGHLVPLALSQNNRDEYSQIIVFTDMQMWGGSFRDEWNTYKQLNPDASLYLVDLNSYGDLVIPEGAQDVYQLSGWSENVIEFIDKMENVDDMIREIELTSYDE